MLQKHKSLFGLVRFVKSQISSAPLLSSKSSVLPHFCPVFPVFFANCPLKSALGFLYFHILVKGLRPALTAKTDRAAQILSAPPVSC